MSVPAVGSTVAFHYSTAGIEVANVPAIVLMTAAEFNQDAADADSGYPQTQPGSTQAWLVVFPADAGRKMDWALAEQQVDGSFVAVS